MKKKVLIIQQSLQGGGAEKVLVDLINNFDYSKYDIDLVIIYKYGVYQDSINRLAHVIFLMGETYPKLLAVLKARGHNMFPRMYLRYLLFKKTGWKKYDTIISFMEGVSTLAHYMVRGKGKKNISWVHTDLIKNNWCLKSFESIQEQSKIYHSMDEVICVSNDSLNAFQKQFNISKCSVIYNIIDTQNIRNRASSQVDRGEKVTIITVGRLAPIKNQKMLVEAANILKQKGIEATYWILGEGPERCLIESKISEYQLEDNIKLFGFQSNPYPFINAADVFVLTSLSEGYPLVVCEAMCLGKPILSTKTTGPSELLGQGVGLLCELDVSDFANKLEQLITNPEIRKELSAKAIQASKSFMVENTMRKIYSIL